MDKHKIMHGFPVKAAHRVPRGDWDRAPWNRWSFQNVRQILATTEVWRGRDAIWELTRRSEDIEKVRFITSGTEVTIDHWLNNSHTDGFIVLHQRTNCV